MAEIGRFLDTAETEDSDSPDTEPDHGRRGPRRDREMREFTLRLIEGTRQHQQEVDQILGAVTRNWDLHRMAAIDRNVLRMAIYELLYCADIPPKVTINEAIELGKRFSTANSGSFINGILDRVRIDIEKGTLPAPARRELEQGS